MARRQQRDVKRERMWRRHITAQKTSGLTIRAYCEQHQLRETSFYFWRLEIAKRDREAAAKPTPAPAFVPVAVIESPPNDTEPNAETPIDIRLADGHRVRVRSGCDRVLLADVLMLLRQRESSADGSNESRPC